MGETLNHILTTENPTILISIVIGVIALIFAAMPQIYRLKTEGDYFVTFLGLPAKLGLLYILILWFSVSSNLSYFQSTNFGFFINLFIFITIGFRGYVWLQQKLEAIKSGATKKMKGLIVFLSFLGGIFIISVVAVIFDTGFQIKNGSNMSNTDAFWIIMFAPFSSFFAMGFRVLVIKLSREPLNLEIFFKSLKEIRHAAFINLFFSLGATGSLLAAGKTFLGLLSLIYAILSTRFALKKYYELEKIFETKRKTSKRK